MRLLGLHPRVGLHSASFSSYSAALEPVSSGEQSQKRLVSRPKPDLLAGNVQTTPHT